MNRRTDHSLQTPQYKRRIMRGQSVPWPSRLPWQARIAACAHKPPRRRVARGAPACMPPGSAMVPQARGFLSASGRLADGIGFRAGRVREAFRSIKAAVRWAFGLAGRDRGRNAPKRRRLLAEVLGRSHARRAGRCSLIENDRQPPTPQADPTFVASMGSHNPFPTTDHVRFAARCAGRMFAIPGPERPSRSPRWSPQIIRSPAPAPSRDSSDGRR